MAPGGKEESGKRPLHSSSSTDPKSFRSPLSKDGTQASDYSEETAIAFDDGDNDIQDLSLCYSKHEKVPIKDFSKEIRASMDVNKCLRNMVVCLNIQKLNLDYIISECLSKALAGEDPQVFDQAKAALFTHDQVHQLSQTIRSTSVSEGGGFAFDQSWVGCMCTVPSLQTKQVAIARLPHPTNLGLNSQEVQLVLIILAPPKEKGTKNDLEVARTFGTILADAKIRRELLESSTEEDFKLILSQATHLLSVAHSILHFVKSDEVLKFRCGLGRGICEDLKRRLPHYFSDYKDGVSDWRAVAKTLSCTLFLYFACILPSIAFGVLNSGNTDGTLTVEKVLVSQVFGGLLFAIIGGTPQIVLLTTAPLALYTSILYTMSKDYDLDFQAFYACVGLFNCMFLIIFSVLDLSILMQYSTRSSEEIFALFISIAFSYDAFKDLGKNVAKYYYCDDDTNNSGLNATNISMANSTTVKGDDCHKEITLLYILLLLGTLWVGVTLFQFKKTPYLNAGKRELLSDYALPFSVIIMAAIGVFVFDDIDIGKSFDAAGNDFKSMFKIADITSLSWGAIAGACGLGFCLSLLFFMDQNISAALINAPQNQMKKGTAYHWDILIIALINGALSIFALPWVHAALPHSPLHVVALAEVEERVDRGRIYQIIVSVRETRLTCIFSHILIGLSFLFLVELAYIPIPVLYGLFLYVAVTALFGNQMFERIQLFFTEQSAYPPNHYICRVPQRKIHLFTTLQIVQLAVLCTVGFFPWPYMKMFFPVLIFLLIPIRHKIIPRFVDWKYLKALDGHH